jgi:signal peptidase I
VLGKAFQFVGVLPDPSTEHLIKRVIGMPGDRVVCCDDNGRITVNDTPLNETAYLYTDRDGVQVAASSIEFEVLVPADRIFVMGDHRDRSSDSRCHLKDTSPSSAIPAAGSPTPWPTRDRSTACSSSSACPPRAPPDT